MRPRVRRCCCLSACDVVTLVEDSAQAPSNSITTTSSSAAAAQLRDAHAMAHDNEPQIAGQYATCDTKHVEIRILNRLGRLRRGRQHWRSTRLNASGSTPGQVPRPPSATLYSIPFHPIHVLMTTDTLVSSVAGNA